MKTVHSMKNRVSNFIALVKAGNTLMNIMILGLIFIALWLLYYAWLIIANPYQAEYREGSILLMTDFFTRGVNPFLLEYQPLMNSNYGFLYNLIVLPFAIKFGNSLAIHRLISILFIIASGVLIGVTLVKNRVSLPFAFSGGILVTACLFFSITPLARPDAFGEFLFLSSILFPWYFGFSRRSLMASVMFGIFAFLAKPYFLVSLIIVLLNQGGKLKAWQSLPWYAFLAGPLGIVIITSIGYATPRLGLAGTLTLIVISQLLIGVMFDHFGWIGQVRTLDLTRLIGILLLFFGTWIVLK